MKKHSNYGRILLLVIFLGVLLSACKKKVKEGTDPNADTKGNWFSIIQFGRDQWNTFAGTPFTILKTVKVNNKTDSSYTNSDTLNWGDAVFKTFFETDISDPKFLSQYAYTHFPDNEDGTQNLYYKANDPDLFTQKLLITADLYTGKVRGIYIETYKKTIWGETKQNLYYAPMQTIQLQTDEKPVIGGRKYTVVQYYFMR